MRRVVLDDMWNSRGYMYATSSMGGSTASIAYYQNYVMVNHPMYQADYNRKSMYTGERAFLNDLTPYEQLKWALFAPLTEEDKNPPTITQETFNEALAWKTKKFSGPTYEKAAQEFNEYAVEHLFSDGLPLVLPTADLVNEMLAGTTRDKNEVLGMMKMRGGIITVEKIAINAVMAGAKPEHLPVLIAAMEAYANGWENDKMWYHNMSTGAYSVGIMMILNGPLAKELGVDSDRGYMGSGHSANNLIGRAFRMCIRNIGHNYTPDVDTQNRLGRLSDITLLVFAEQEDRLPAQWKPHHVMMGFDAAQSTVTMIGAFTTPAVYNSEDQTNNWSPITAMQETRGHTTTTANVQLFPAAVADILATESISGNINGVSYYMPTKEAVKEWWATHNATSGTTTRSAGIYNVSFPIVAGGNPNYIASVYGFEGLYATLCYQTQLISGATLTTNGRGATVPSTPQNFNVEFNPAGTSATLTWDAPLSDGGSAITSYSVNNVHGGNQQTSPWTTVTGGAAANSYTYTGLTPGRQYFFKVRANNGVVNSAEFTSATTAISSRGSGHGAWAFFSDEELPTTVNIIGPASVTATAGATASYIVSVENAPDVSAVQLKLRVDGAYFTTKSSSGLDGFAGVGNINWVEVSTGIWEGEIVLAGSGNSGGFDVFQIDFDLTGLLGTTVVELVDVKLAYGGSWVDFVLGDSSVETEIAQWYSIFDVNKDGVIDLRDISMAMIYYMAEAGDANWDDAKVADVNGDGVVDIEDLIQIRANFT